MMEFFGLVNTNLKKGVNNMKIKHWQGYGCLDIVKLSRTKSKLVLQITGNHEYGIELGWRHKWDLADWLGKAFKFKANDIERFEENLSYIRINDYITERNTITIYLREDNNSNERI